MQELAYVTSCKYEDRIQDWGTFSNVTMSHFIKANTEHNG